MYIYRVYVHVYLLKHIYIYIRLSLTPSEPPWAPKPTIRSSALRAPGPDSPQRPSVACHAISRQSKPGLPGPGPEHSASAAIRGLGFMMSTSLGVSDYRGRTLNSRIPIIVRTPKQGPHDVVLSIISSTGLPG